MTVVRQINPAMSDDGFRTLTQRWNEIRPVLIEAGQDEAAVDGPFQYGFWSGATAMLAMMTYLAESGITPDDMRAVYQHWHKEVIEFADNAMPMRH